MSDQVETNTLNRRLHSIAADSQRHVDGFFPEFTRVARTRLFGLVRFRHVSTSGGVLMTHGIWGFQPTSLIKYPLVLEFLGFEKRSTYSERDMERAIIDQL